MEAFLIEAGVNWASGQQTEENLTALRATYEPLLDGLRLALLLTLPTWIAAEDAADHWQRGHRGMIARRLIEQLSSRTQDSSEPKAARFAQRLRSRLNRD